MAIKLKANLPISRFDPMTLDMVQSTKYQVLELEN